MDYYLAIYKVTLEGLKACHGKAGIASNDFYPGWVTAKVKIFKNYPLSFPNVRRREIEADKCSKVSLRKYHAFASIA